ncbi:MULTISPECIES: DUF2946 family protein [Luteimonas]|uniref:DUF2946 family protein n=1 Tax=Luteimonas TaxID=83614 RepID=UPI000C7ADA84
MFRRPTPAHWTRLLLLALLVLGVIGAPVLAAIGSTHDLFHDAGRTAHTHDIGHADAGDEDDGAAGLLHAAMHCATCGGHTSALPATPTMIGPASAQPFEAAVAHTAPTRRPDSLLRPPISA